MYGDEDGMDASICHTTDINSLRVTPTGFNHPCVNTCRKGSPRLLSRSGPVHPTGDELPRSFQARADPGGEQSGPVVAA